MTENQKKILEMWPIKRITLDEAYRLMSLINHRQRPAVMGLKAETVDKVFAGGCRYEHHWENGCDKGPQHINIRVPGL